MKATSPKQSRPARSSKWFQRRRRRHDPMLVLSMLNFNSGSSWNQIFNPVPQRENVWC